MGGSRVVGLICDHRTFDGQPAHLVPDAYVTAVRESTGALPLLVPVLDEPLETAAVLDAVAGLVFTGSPSNVAPRHYGGMPARAPVHEDANRDALVLPLIRAAVAAGLPIVAICRGFQELNVALGGTLHQHVHELPGRLDHREAAEAPIEVQYGPAHEVTITPGGMLAGLGLAARFTVNSLHGQGIDRLASPLREEARAPDGQIEAASLFGSRAFTIGVQWHPEWRWSEHAPSRAIWQAFAEALARV